MKIRQTIRHARFMYELKKDGFWMQVNWQLDRLHDPLVIVLIYHVAFLAFLAYQGIKALLGFPV